MLIRLSPTKNSIRFIGDVSIFILNKYGVVLQEYEDPSLPGYWRQDYVSYKDAELFYEMALKAGAKKFKTIKTQEDRFNFSKVTEGNY